MSRGLIFEVREFCLHDGPGIRTTVFFKGCPLRCPWCHNPEGLSFAPQLLIAPQSCVHCGACKRVCPRLPGAPCRACGACSKVCPQGCRRLCGVWREPAELAAELLRDRDFFLNNGGGISFSGGEPLAQADFLLELCPLLKPVHLAIETSGYAPLATYQRVVEHMDLVFQDLKHADPAEHRRLTGVDNAPILRNLAWLKESGRPFIARIPLIPGVTDSEDNQRRCADLLSGPSAMLRVELLPYHLGAGSKYAMAGLKYQPGFDEHAAVQPRPDLFQDRGLKCVVM